MKNKDAIIAKIAKVRNCLKSIKTATDFDPLRIEDQFVEDVFVLNLERAIQSCIDIANLIIAQQDLGLPRSYRHSFEILAQHQLISGDFADKMKKMAGFRNIAVHNYTALDKEILKSILTERLGDLEDFCTVIFKFNAKDPQPG